MLLTGLISAANAQEKNELTGLIGRDIVATPLAEVAGRQKPLDLGLLELARVLAQ